MVNLQAIHHKNSKDELRNLRGCELHTKLVGQNIYELHPNVASHEKSEFHPRTANYPSDENHTWSVSHSGRGFQTTFVSHNVCELQKATSHTSRELHNSSTPQTRKDLKSIDTCEPGETNQCIT